jgi:hypothetical protein
VAVTLALLPKSGLIGEPQVCNENQFKLDERQSVFAKISCILNQVKLTQGCPPTEVGKDSFLIVLFFSNKQERKMRSIAIAVDVMSKFNDYTCSTKHDHSRTSTCYGSKLSKQMLTFLPSSAARCPTNL